MLISIVRRNGLHFSITHIKFSEETIRWIRHPWVVAWAAARGAVSRPFPRKPCPRRHHAAQRLLAERREPWHRPTGGARICASKSRTGLGIYVPRYPFLYNDDCTVLFLFSPSSLLSLSSMDRRRIFMSLSLSITDYGDAAYESTMR